VNASLCDRRLSYALLQFGRLPTIGRGVILNPADTYQDGRLHARPAVLQQLAHARHPPLAAGLHQISFSDGRSARLHVPEHSEAQLPLLVLLHGAGGLHGGADQLALAHAMRHGELLLMPDAVGISWDVLRGAYGADLAFIDRALLWTMLRYQVDPQAVAIGGFSDGASYALSVGLMNGDLFSDILAFSPGFIKPLRRTGLPRIFISHGRGDRVLSVTLGRGIAQRLAQAGYAVEYDEFEGEHLVPEQVAQQALRRLAPGS